MVVEKNMLILPEDLSFEKAAFCESLSVMSLFDKSELSILGYPLSFPSVILKPYSSHILACSVGGKSFITFSILFIKFLEIY